jgi:CRP/FNR family transcriptional regulator, anaerobic regulatory protein
MEKLLAFLDGIFPLSSELREELVRILKTRSFRRKEFLLRAGHVSRTIYFVEHGLIRCFYMLGDRDISAWFMKEGDVVVSVNSFFIQVPSAESIQALEDTTVHYIHYEELERLYHRFLSFNVHGRKVLTHYYCLSEQRTISMRSMKARERYAYLVDHHPELLQRVPRKYLASYLGVTEATLSNINSPKQKIAI